MKSCLYCRLCCNHRIIEWFWGETLTIIHPHGQGHNPLDSIGLYQAEYLKRTKSALLNSR